MFECLILDVMTHCGHGQDAPPHAVQEGPFTILKLRVSLNEEDQRSEGENCNSNQDHHQAKFLVSLLQSVCERLDPSEMSD